MTRHLLVTLAVVGGCLTACQAATAPVDTAPAETAAGSTATATSGAEVRDRLPEFRSVRRHDPVARPLRVRIPSIGVSSGLETLRNAPDRTIEVPGNPDSAGWYADGPRPGQQGPAVVLGHVDSRRGPAVFARLSTMKKGDPVLVDRADGTTARFSVDRIEQHPKQQFPTDSVYYPTLQRELRLVTCGGRIDPTTGHYEDNVIVYATAVRDAAP